MPIISYKVQGAKGRDRQWILIESEARGNVPRNASRKHIMEAAEDFEKNLKPITALAESIRRTLSELNNPGKIVIEFGIEIGLKVGIPVVTCGETKGNFKVTLEYETNARSEPSKKRRNGRAEKAKIA